MGKKDTREKALNTARKLFIKKGKDGVRMQEIADVSGVNKGLLHYYFKSKENLFREVFEQEFQNLYGSIYEILKVQVGLENKLAAIIDHVFGQNMKLDNYAAFMSFECSRNKALVKKLESQANFKMSVELLNTELRENRISSTSQFSLQVLLNVLSLCSFPFALKHMVESTNEFSSWEEFLEARKTFLKAIVIGSFVSS